MCGSDEPHLYPERSSPTSLSTSGHALLQRGIVYNKMGFLFSKWDERKQELPVRHY